MSLQLHPDALRLSALALHGADVLSIPGEKHQPCTNPPMGGIQPLPAPEFLRLFLELRQKYLKEFAPR
jgi:hypothetical protein